MSIQLSRRSIASRKNGRLGGLATAANHSVEFLEARASKAGTATRDTYGADYYRYLAQKKPSKEKQRKELLKEITNSVSEPESTASLMQAAAKTLQM